MEDKQLDLLIRKFYSVSVLAHITHENTRSIATHEALGEFYSKVNSIKDRVIEHLMGTGKLIRVNANILEIGSDIASEATILGSTFCAYADMTDDDALENIAGELVEAVGHLKYKLMFS